MPNYSELGSLLSEFSAIAIPIIITVFVLAVTLLGRAAKLTKEKQSEEIQKSKEGFDKDILQLKEQIEKNPDDIEALKTKVSDLEVKKSFTASSLLGISKTYRALTFEGGVLSPGKWFLLTLIIERWFVGQYSWPPAINFIYFLSALIFMCLGVHGIILTLKSIQTIALETQDEQLEQIKDAIIEGMKTIEAEKEPKPTLKFKEQPPFVFPPNSENTIEFEVQLMLPGAKEANNLDVWFLLSPEIKILENSKYHKPFKQNSEYVISEANTTIYKFDRVTKHVKSSGKLKIFTSVPGEYKLRYKIDCQNHVEAATKEKEISLIVKEN